MLLNAQKKTVINNKNSNKIICTKLQRVLKMSSEVNISFQWYLIIFCNKKMNGIFIQLATFDIGHFINSKN